MGLFSLDDNVKWHWQWYRSFFQITIFRYLITWFALVPVLAKILDNAQEYLKIQTAYGEFFIIQLSLPFTWELLWLASFFFVVAYALYIYYRPRFISVYPTFNEYLMIGHSPRWIVWEAVDIVKNKKELPKFVERLAKKGYIVETEFENIDNSKVKPEVLKDQTQLKFNYQDKTYILGMPIVNEAGEFQEKETDVAEKEIFWEVLGRFSSSKKDVRELIKFFLLISLVCFLFVFGQHIWAGLVYIYKEVESFFTLSLLN